MTRFSRMIVSCCLVAGAFGAGQASAQGAGDAVRVVASEVVSYAADRAVARGRNLPAPAAQIAYANTTEFDTGLYSSLRNVERSRQPDVRVTLPASSTELPERLRLWTSNIQNRGGVILRCTPATAAGLGGILEDILTIVAGPLLNVVRNWGLYRPARSVGAIIEMDPASDQPTAVRFFRRDQQQAMQAGYARCQV